MKLKEKFLNAYTTYGGIGINEKQADHCVIIADNYADTFGNWLRENDDEDLLISELLEIFIKENEL